MQQFRGFTDEDPQTTFNSKSPKGRSGPANPGQSPLDKSKQWPTGDPRHTRAFPLAIGSKVLLGEKRETCYY